MFRSVILLCVVAAFVKGQTTTVNQCSGSNPGARPLNTYVEGCESPPCQLPRGSFAVIHLVFEAPYVIRSMETQATAYMLLLPVDYPLGDGAVTCNFITNTYCPILPGEIIQYTLRMRIEDIFPLITLPIEFKIVDENENRIMCIRFSVTVLPAINGRNATLSIN